MQPFSVLMSVYCNDKPEDFRTAVESISIRQTVQPDEIYIYVDGPVPEKLANEINKLAQELSTINVHWEKENKGLGIALQYGVEHVKNELIARMDADDIAAPNRFEKQLAMFKADPELGMIGSNISEFIDNESNIVSHRMVPSVNEEIRSYMKRRCAFNHMTVMYKKSEVLKAGNYQDWFWNEDYYLWIRMMLSNCKFANIPESLVNVRVGKDMYARRGGWRYFKSEKGLQFYMLKHKMISLPVCIYNTLIRFVLQVLLPVRLRGFIFRKFARE